ncbi:4'-phosphopantetheinyl transferase superfamily protein [Paenibacillus sp. UMB7766-LJ446]|uniref:4'-phosphopantetheinyl transferase family protein n=1 Tax=Paenibacillus sp. UMB7766-LJ446 TaxID=3046313 RepID=UPI00254C9987|nr:4'-phosphopantetheinyl transferase superfamily protein [Paenibacillus sp. UMB7766-LJ446]MDK8193021.1 4'-phosphopantetheinyl transferase superfamily protein [Paenibacillus sp. UMB7766-LJ446]
MLNTGKTEIHLWKQALPISEDQVQLAVMMDQTMLTSEEQQRVSRIGKSSLLKAQGWMSSRLFLRSVLAQYMQLQARDIQFNYGISGKPYVQGGPRFSLSHTKGLCVLAVMSSVAELGVDVEWVRPLLRQQAIINRFLTAEEQGYILNGVRKGQERSRMLWEMLTRKEAWIKASGQALCGQWRTLNTMGKHFAEKSLVEREGRSFMLRELEVGRGYIAALCLEGEIDPSIRWMS